MINLTKKEREYFALYLKQEAEGDDVMIALLEKSPTGGADIVANMMKKRSLAFKLVAKDLLSREEMTVR